METIITNEQEFVDALDAHGDAFKRDVSLEEFEYVEASSDATRDLPVLNNGDLNKGDEVFTYENREAPNEQFRVVVRGPRSPKRPLVEMIRDGLFSYFATR
jgi:hypothetical protein